MNREGKYIILSLGSYFLKLTDIRLQSDKRKCAFTQRTMNLEISATAQEVKATGLDGFKGGFNKFQRTDRSTVITYNN